MYCRKRLVLGYSAQIAVSDDHLIVAQRVTQQANENRSLAPMIELTRHTCGQPPGRVVADSGFYSNNSLEQPRATGPSMFMCLTRIWPAS